MTFIYYTHIYKENYNKTFYIFIISTNTIKQNNKIIYIL